MSASLCNLFVSFSASDNIPKADEIRTLIKDVWDTRIAKLRVSADSFVRQQEAHAKVGVLLRDFLQHSACVGYHKQELLAVLLKIIGFLFLFSRFFTFSQSETSQPTLFSLVF